MQNEAKVIFANYNLKDLYDFWLNNIYQPLKSKNKLNLKNLYISSDDIKSVMLSGSIDEITASTSAFDERFVQNIDNLGVFQQWQDCLEFAEHLMSNVFTRCLQRGLEIIYYNKRDSFLTEDADFQTIGDLGVRNLRDVFQCIVQPEVIFPFTIESDKALKSNEAKFFKFMNDVEFKDSRILRMIFGTFWNAFKEGGQNDIIDSEYIVNNLIQRLVRDIGYIYNKCIIKNDLPDTLEEMSLITEFKFFMKPSVIVMRGLPGSGKSSLIQRLISLRPFKEIKFPGKEDISICSADDFFMQVDGSYLFNHNLLSNAHSTCQIKFIEAMDRNVHTIFVDNCNVAREHLNFYKEQAENPANDYQYIEIMPRDMSLLLDSIDEGNDIDIDNQIEVFAERNKHGVTFETIKRMLEKWKD